MKYKRQDGTQLWLSNGKFGGELTVAKNKVFIRSGSSGVTMFNATTGAKLETINTVTFYKFPSGSSFVVLMDGKAYYPPSSGMNTTN